MKKLIALLLALLMLSGLVSAHAEMADKYDLLVVGTLTPFSGNFLTDALGSNISDQDVRNLIHGYSLVYWNSESGAFQFNERLLTAVHVSEDGRTFTFKLQEDLTYNDGTPITSLDYAFALLLLGSPEMERATGASEDISRIEGGQNYRAGFTKQLKGVRIITDTLFSVTLDASFTPYFYELKCFDITPLPIGTIAPGCTIADSEEGASISGPYSTDLLKQTLMDPDTGYISHPVVSCGPYSFKDYDGTKVTLELNKAYSGDHDGNVPTIPQIVIQVEDPDTIMDKLSAGEINLAVRCARSEQINAGIQLVQGGDYKMSAYSRSGLGFISFCAESGATADQRVRQAVSMCLDKETLTEDYLGAYGMTVKGYYGIGQWMFAKITTETHDEDEEEAWVDLNMDGIPEFPFNPEGTAELLDAAGWTLNENGEPYDPAVGGIRYRKPGEELIPLKLKLIYPEGNGAGPMLDETFKPYLAQAGIELETEAVPMPELLKVYYGQVSRDCDMILLGTNFGDVFDPSPEYDENGTSRLNGITNSELAQEAIELRSTEPGKAFEYCQRWLKYIADRAAIIPEIPLYSDAYLDFHINELQNYRPAETGSWTNAIQKAVLSDYVEEEETPEDGLEEGPEDGDEEFLD